MPDLAAWLLEQIAEDERVAKAASVESAAWFVDGPAAHSGRWWVYETGEKFACREIAEHIAAWDPARVLAECEAKKKIIEAHEAVRLEDFEPWCSACGCLDCDPTSAVWPCLTLRWLALPYADRPGYREDWRP